MKWYFALSEATIDRPGHDWRNMIRVAVQSAQQNTSLQPTLLYDGDHSAFTQELSDRGVKVIFHRVSFYEKLKEHGIGDRDYLAIASGAFLRFDIPAIENDDQYVLYSDCDVVFRRNPDFYGSSQPDFFAASSQTSMDPGADMNSGVMLLNVPGMRSALPDLIGFTVKNLHIGLDQEVLRVYFERHYTPMDLSLNWKPYWGTNPNAQIIHFHGPKPSHERTFSAEVLEKVHPSWLELYKRSPDGYFVYGKLWLEHLQSYNAPQHPTTALDN